MYGEDGKSRLQSKTYWSAILLACLGALQTNISVIPAEYQGWSLIFVAGLMAALREYTSQPLR